MATCEPHSLASLTAIFKTVMPDAEGAYSVNSMEGALSIMKRFVINHVDSGDSGTAPLLDIFFQKPEQPRFAFNSQ